MTGRGPWGKARLPSVSPGLGRGWGRWSRSRHHPGAWRQCQGDQEQCRHSEFDLVRFSPASVRRNARKSLKFKFSKFSSLSDHHIGQGTLSYFCFKERRSFAEIYISKLGMVAVSDSNFGSSLSDALV
jgi:hypothetical protein